MNRVGKIAVFCVLAAFLGLDAGAAAEQNYADFSRYQIILSRKPFGEPPPPPAPAVTNLPPGQDPLRNIRLVGLTYHEDYGIRVGLVDVGINPARSHLLAVGERTDDGIIVVDADMELEGVVLEKDGIKRWFQMSGGGVAAQPPGGRPGVSGPGGAPAAPMGVSSEIPASYKERLRKRQEERAIRTRVVEEPSLKGAELEAHLQTLNMELIRAAARGEQQGPPLPIQLTPEQDKQLVEEGVLPAQ